MYISNGLNIRKCEYLNVFLLFACANIKKNRIREY